MKRNKLELYYNFRKIVLSHPTKEKYNFSVFVSERFRLYNEENKKYQQTNLSFLKAGAKKFGVSLMKGGVYMIYRGKELVYIGYGKTDVLRALTRHFHYYNDKYERNRVELPKEKEYTVKILVAADKTASNFYVEMFLINKYRPPLNREYYDSYFSMEEVNGKTFEEFDREQKRKENLSKDVQEWFLKTNGVNLISKGGDVYEVENVDKYEFTDSEGNTYKGEELNNIIKEFSESRDFVPF